MGHGEQGLLCTLHSALCTSTTALCFFILASHTFVTIQAPLSCQTSNFIESSTVLTQFANFAQLYMGSMVYSHKGYPHQPIVFSLHTFVEDRI